MSAVPGVEPMSTDPGVELLERALAYTQGALVTITPAHLGLRTPCAHWRLVDLLAHMEDSLDAFAEGATGVISLHSAAPAAVGDQIAALQTKACGLLGAWASATTPLVEVGGRPVPVGTISRLAALEIATHGWDVGRTTGHAAPLPDELAEGLLPTALAVALEQHGEFGPPVPVSADAGPGRRLLGLLGRRGS
ncbi:MULTISPECIES: TIGR03086 family metal-binding protein [unclassified Nocardioides]|uniref:TIGR03086 family metal-binding protein n=1 Tax=unclassified Nocardioides TaxID=2615069 RepID=UPI0006F2DF64|nr:MULTISPECIES: TIGR03086 family metal-binding protein [unclassified Nocardioides]